MLLAFSFSLVNNPGANQGVQAMPKRYTLSLAGSRGDLLAANPVTFSKTQQEISTLSTERGKDDVKKSAEAVRGKPGSKETSSTTSSLRAEQGTNKQSDHAFNKLADSKQ